MFEIGGKLALKQTTAQADALTRRCAIKCLLVSLNELLISVNMQSIRKIN